MNEYEDKAERRRKKAEFITQKTKEFLLNLLLENEQIYQKFSKAQKRTRKKKGDPKIEIPKVYEEVIEENDIKITNAERATINDLHELVSKYEKRIVSFIREQITSDDDKFL